MMESLYLISPVLIKELRQELRMRSFGLFFVLPQVCAALVLLLQAGNDMSSKDLSGLAQGIFYGCLFLPLFFLIPARAFASISKDSDAGALELMSLTRMTTWHVAAGKWLALSAMAFLFVSAMAPYALLQYFFSNTNPLNLLGQLFLAWIGSVLVSAFVLASAPLRNRGASWGLGLVLLMIGLPSIASMLFDRRGSSSALTLLSSLTDFSVFCLVTVLGVLLLVEVTASKLASPMDDFGPRKRLVAFGCVGITSILVVSGIGIPDLTVTCLILFAIPTVITSMFEETSPVMTRRIVQRGGGLLWFISRGWPAGLLSSAIIEGMALASAKHAGYFDDTSFFALYIPLLAATFVPYVALQCFASGRGRTILSYCILQGCSLILIPVLTGFSRNILSFFLTIIAQGTVAGFAMGLERSTSKAMYGEGGNPLGVIISTIMVALCLVYFVTKFNTLRKRANHSLEARDAARQIDSTVADV